MKNTLQNVLGGVLAAVAAVVAFLMFMPPIEVVQESDVLGSGNTTLMSSVQKADICKVAATNSTTLCTLVNTDGDSAKRVVDSIVFYSDSLQFPVTSSIRISTSTSATCASTDGLWTLTSLTSSSVAQRVATSTYTLAASRAWGYGEYVTACTDGAVTSTGYVKVLYDKIPLN